MNQAFSKQFPADLADRCVSCGLCLPHCPTYALAQQEGDSPRGRISLMQGLAAGQLEPSPALLGHLDRCLTCRSCERVCPADVPYGRLIDAARSGLAESGHGAARTALISAWILSKPWLARFLTACLRLARRSGLLSLAVRSGPAGIRRLAARVPAGLRTWRRDEIAPIRSRDDAVQIFTGCVAPLVDARTLDDAIRVLRAMGFEPLCQEEQVCCGALHQHAGARQAARALARENCAAFGDAATPVLGLASGCTATLSEYASLIEGAEALSQNVHDIVRWVADHQDRLPPLALPEARTVVVHEPCTLRNVLRDQAALGALLDTIENLSWRPLDPPHSCCGGAGSYMLTQPAVADALAEGHLIALRSDPPDVLLTGNIGCALHLQAAAADLGLSTRIEHPISMIAMALPASADNTRQGVV